MPEKIEVLVGTGGSVPSKWSRWEAETAYNPLRSVSHNGSGYVCKKACTGVDPESDVLAGDSVEGEYWILTAKKGDTGATPNFQMGTVDTLAAGSKASASITGTPEKPVLNLGIPTGAQGQKGNVGPRGPAPDLQMGTISTLGEDENASASITGTPEKPLLNLGIPRGKTGKAGYTPVKGKDYFDGAPGYTPQKGVDYFDGAPGYTPVKGKDYFDGVSPTVEVTETEGGHMVDITDANGTKSFEVLDGAGGQVWLTDSEGVPGEIILISTLYKLYGHVEANYDDVQAGDRVIVTSTGAVVEVVAKHEKYGFNQMPSVSLSQVLYYMDGYTGGSGEAGKDGVSPTVSITPITGGHRVSVTDKNGTKTFDVMNGSDGATGARGPAGEDGVSPTVSITPITGGHRVSITDKNGDDSFDVMNGSDGATGPSGKDGQDGAAGKDGVSPTVEITEITGGHRITITDATGEHTFDVMDGEDGSGGGTGGSATGLIGTSFAAGADMNTLVPSGGNNYEVFWSNATSSTHYVNAPPDRADGMYFPTVIAIRFGAWGAVVAQYYYCLETTDTHDKYCEVWMRKGVYNSTEWTEWKQVYPVQGGGVTSWNDLPDKPDSLPYVEKGYGVVLPETTVEIPEGSAGLPGILNVSSGKPYEVNWNGTIYNCVAQSTNIEGMDAIALGNVGALTGVSSTDEPFVLVCFDVLLEGQFGTMVIAFDGVTTVTLSISGEMDIIHPIDERCLPMEGRIQYIDVAMTELRVDGASGTYQTITAAAQSGVFLFARITESTSGNISYAPLAVFNNTEVSFLVAGTNNSLLVCNIDGTWELKV